MDGSAKARARLSPDGQDGWAMYSAGRSDAGATLSPSPLRWTSSSGASSLGTVVYEDWPVPATSVPRLLFSPPPRQTHDAIETAPKPVQPVSVGVEAEEERFERCGKRWSLYTTENVERLRRSLSLPSCRARLTPGLPGEEEDGALLVWLDFPSCASYTLRLEVSLTSSAKCPTTSLHRLSDRPQRSEHG